MLDQIRAEEVLVAIIKAIDMINPILKHHHRRTAIIAYNLGKSMQLSEKSMTDLVITATLHDIGALTVKDEAALVKLDVENPNEHAVIGAGILSNYEPFRKISQIVRHHHIHFSDFQSSKNMMREAPKEAFLLHLADRIDVLLNHDEPALNQVHEITSKIQALSGTLFSPESVQHFLRLAEKEHFWFDIETMEMEDLLKKINMDFICIENSYQSLESLIFTLSKIFDYKSSYTVIHSVGVANMAYQLAKLYGLSEERCLEIKLGGYLHDVGKIAIPSEIINTPEKLSVDEFNKMKTHPYYTSKILSSIKGLSEISYWASSHHETLDQTGYPYKPDKNEFVIEIQIIAYADVFTALCEDRPYRCAYHYQSAIALIEKEFVSKLGDEIYPLLKRNAKDLGERLQQIQQIEMQKYQDIVESF